MVVTQCGSSVCFKIFSSCDGAFYMGYEMYSCVNLVGMKGEKVKIRRDN